jgi:hypothetical protein
MPSLGFLELLALPVVVLMIFGLNRLTRLTGSARRELPSGARTKAAPPSEPVGLTLRQIQFRGPHPARPQPGPEESDARAS